MHLLFIKNVMMSRKDREVDLRRFEQYCKNLQYNFDV